VSPASVVRRRGRQAEFAATEVRQALHQPLTPDDTAAVVAMLAGGSDSHAPLAPGLPRRIQNGAQDGGPDRWRRTRRRRLARAGCRVCTNPNGHTNGHLGGVPLRPSEHRVAARREQPVGLASSSVVRSGNCERSMMPWPRRRPASSPRWPARRPASWVIQETQQARTRSRPVRAGRPPLSGGGPWRSPRAGARGLRAA
jgi:hypothetical protein